MKKQVEVTDLRLIAFSSIMPLAMEVDKHLLAMYGIDNKQYTFIVPTRETFFSDGHLKTEILETVRGKDVYMMTDVCNYSTTYTMRGLQNNTSPNDLFIQLLDGIGTCHTHVERLNVILTILAAGRQHRRNTRENLLCAMLLHILDTISPRMRSVVTFDAHDPGVDQAVHNIEFDNVFPSNYILKDVINDLDCSLLEKIVFIAPDNGAAGRRNIYLNSFNSKYIYRQAGSFYKERDYNHIVDGKNPITAHSYSGNEDIEGFTAIVTDDMIASGDSMFDVIDGLRKRGVKHIYVITTFTLLTEGIARFQEYYNNGLLDGVYTTNLTYIPEDYQKNEWLHVCDCSELVAQVIYNIHKHLSLSDILGDRAYPVRLLEEKFSEGPYQSLARTKQEQ